MSRHVYSFSSSNTYIFWGTTWQRGKRLTIKGLVLSDWIPESRRTSLSHGCITWKVLEEIQVGWSEWALALLPERTSQVLHIRICKASPSRRQEPQWLSPGHLSSAHQSSTAVLHWGIKSATLHSRVIQNILVLIFIMSLNSISSFSLFIISVCPVISLLSMLTCLHTVIL